MSLFVRQSVCYQLVKMFITIELHPNHMVYFNYMLHKYACGQLVKNLITHEPYRIYGSYFAYMLILILAIHPALQNSGEGLPSIILAGRGFCSEYAHN